MRQHSFSCQKKRCHKKQQHDFAQHTPRASRAVNARDGHGRDGKKAEVLATKQLFAKNLSKQLCESRRRKNDTDGSSERLKASVRKKELESSYMYAPQETVKKESSACNQPYQQFSHSTYLSCRHHDFPTWTQQLSTASARAARGFPERSGGGRAELVVSHGRGQSKAVEVFTRQHRPFPFPPPLR